MITHDNMSTTCLSFAIFPTSCSIRRRITLRSAIERRSWFSPPGRPRWHAQLLLIVPTSMCASHEATQISMMSEFLHYSREKYPNVDGRCRNSVTTRACGCQDGSTLDVNDAHAVALCRSSERRRSYLIESCCEKTNLTFRRKVPDKSRKANREALIFKIGIQDVAGTQAAIEIGLREVASMLPEVNKCEREEVR